MVVVGASCGTRTEPRQEGAARFCNGIHRAQLGGGLAGVCDCSLRLFALRLAARRVSRADSAFLPLMNLTGGFKNGREFSGSTCAIRAGIFQTLTTEMRLYEVPEAPR